MEEGQSNNKYIQESLQPQRLKPEDKAYQSVCDIAERLQKEDATNIALTGPYGSGKSSVLITLKADYSQYKYLNISLATLKTLCDNDNTNNHSNEETSKENIDRLIEYSILQQLVYRENQETLQYSRLKRIFHLSKEKIKNYSWSIVLAFLALIIVFEPKFLYIEWMLNLFGYKWLNIIGDIIGILYLIWFFYKALQIIVPALSNSRLNKLNLKSGEIEIVSNTSIFNKHLDEILYFFEKTDYNVVIIEDLDRFDSTAIFLKLRELNLLLNESKVIHRKVFFIYAVRDDMFKDSDRVKCFDYITTVIPFINRSNAKNQLKAELEKRGVTDIKDRHLRELGFFLHDMRLLKNIANEYVQYRNKLENGISCEKLLAMIVYKNYYPKDFAELHDCKGCVYQLLNLKDIFISDRLTNLENEYASQQKQFLQHQKERHLKESELRRIYIDAYRDRLGDNVQKFIIGNDSYTSKDIALNEKLFDKLISTSDVTYLYVTSNNYGRLQQATANIQFSEIEKTVDPSVSYYNRLDAIRVEYSQIEPLVLEIKKEDVRSQSLSRIMETVDYHTNEDYMALKVPPLIEFLIVKGYIDENYYDYISYFYDNFIDIHDWNFILAIKTGRLHPYDYTINNIESCMQEIPNSVYRKNAILNINIVDYLVSKQTDRINEKRLAVVLGTIVDNKKYDFLIAYYQKGKIPDVLFECLFSKYKTLWSDILKYDNDDNQLKLIWYKYAEKDMSCDGSKYWLLNNYDFITDHLSDLDIELWRHLIDKYDYQFDKINGYSRDIINIVVEKGAYNINRNNIVTIVSCLLDKQYDSVSYKLVTATENKRLLQRVDDNIVTCLKSVFYVPESEKEDTESIVKILKSDIIEESDKITYLGRQQNKIDFDKIDTNENKKLSLKCDIINPSWENVVYYMNIVSDKMLNEELTTFIEYHIEDFSTLITPRTSDDDEKMLLQQLIETNTLSFESYKKVLKQFSRWHFVGIPSIEERRVALLIENGMIHLNEENTNGLLDKYSEKIVVSYLLKNKREFLKKPETVKYTTDVAIGLMKANMTSADKSKIIPCLKDVALDEELANLIISVMDANEIIIDADFLIRVMSLSSLTFKKINIFNYTLEDGILDADSITEILNTLPYPYNNIAEKGKKPEIQNTPQSNKLVQLLKNNNYISTYSETRKGIRVYTKTK